MSRRMVLNFGSFEVYKSASYMYLTLATEFFNRSICLSAHIDMAWLPWHTMLKPFMSRHNISHCSPGRDWCGFLWYLSLVLVWWGGHLWNKSFDFKLFLFSGGSGFHNSGWDGKVLTGAWRADCGCACLWGGQNRRQNHSKHNIICGSVSVVYVCGRKHSVNINDQLLSYVFPWFVRTWV